MNDDIVSLKLYGPVPVYSVLQHNITMSCTCTKHNGWTISSLGGIDIFCSLKSPKTYFAKTVHKTNFV